jgi:hypothetical protein
VTALNCYTSYPPMSEHLWSKTKTDWTGFKPVSYWFDSDKVLRLPLTENANGDAQAMTIGDVWLKLKDKQLTQDSFKEGFGGIETDIETTEGLKLRLAGPDFNRRILETLLRFKAEGIHPFSVVLYYYDKDICLQDPQQCFIFFAVYDGKIVRERLPFFDHYNSGFDPSVFEPMDYSDRTWEDEAEWAEAQTKYWYRKFYSETHTGQLMQLRPDTPTLYFNQDRTAPDMMSALGVVARSLNSVRLLLWGVLILLAVSFFLRWIR